MPTHTDLNLQRFREYYFIKISVSGSLLSALNQASIMSNKKKFCQNLQKYLPIFCFVVCALICETFSSDDLEIEIETEQPEINFNEDELNNSISTIVRLVYERYS